MAQKMFGLGWLSETTGKYYLNVLSCSLLLSLSLLLTCCNLSVQKAIYINRLVKFKDRSCSSSILVYSELSGVWHIAVAHEMSDE